MPDNPKQPYLEDDTCQLPDCYIPTDQDQPKQPGHHKLPDNGGFTIGLVFFVYRHGGSIFDVVL